MLKVIVTVVSNGAPLQLISSAEDILDVQEMLND